MDLSAAQQQFKNIVASTDQKSVRKFLLWVKNEFCSDDKISELCRTNEDVVLESICDDLRQSVPLTAVIPTEQIAKPVVGENADCDPATTVHVDAFLYDDDTVDRLCDEGKMSRVYCKRCGAHQTAPLNFISHSASIAEIKYLFQFALPDLSGKTIIDIGSRLGPVLYGAYYYSHASRIYGVELNGELCQLQERVLEKYHLQDRVQVVHADVCTQESLLKQGDVIVMNNVFEFFAPMDIQARIWMFLYETLRKSGSLLVTIPSVEVSLQHLQTSIDVTTWLDPVDLSSVRREAMEEVYGPGHNEEGDFDDIYMYRIK